MGSIRSKREWGEYLEGESEKGEGGRGGEGGGEERRVEERMGWMCGKMGGWEDGNAMRCASFSSTRVDLLLLL